MVLEAADLRWALGLLGRRSSARRLPGGAQPDRRGRLSLRDSAETLSEGHQYVSNLVGHETVA
jgi:hypothetical protein